MKLVKQNIDDTCSVRWNHSFLIHYFDVMCEKLIAGAPISLAGSAGFR